MPSQVWQQSWQVPNEIRGNQNIPARQALCLLEGPKDSIFAERSRSDPGGHQQQLASEQDAIQRPGDRHIREDH